MGKARNEKENHHFPVFLTQSDVLSGRNHLFGVQALIEDVFKIALRALISVFRN